MNRATRTLVKHVEKRAGETHSDLEAEAFINAGADIKALIQSKTMIDFVIDKERQLRVIQSFKADNCLRLIEVLRGRASSLLATQIRSSNGGDINEIRQLIQLGASTYQSRTFGALGLLGDLLMQNQTPIRLEIVQVLIESDPKTAASLAAENEAKETCLSIARANPKCGREVVDYLQHEFDKLLNKIPFSKTVFDSKEVIKWIDRGANPEMADEKGNTVLSNAVIASNLDLVRMLISHGCNISHVNAAKLTPLDIAKNAVPRNTLLIAVCQTQNVNIELRDLIQARKSHLTIAEVSALLNKGANINASIINHGSFLHLLITNNPTPEMLTAFVNEFMADITIMDSRGHRAIETCVLIDDKPFILLNTFFKLSTSSTSLFFNPKLNKTLLQFAIEEKRNGAADMIQSELNAHLWTCVIENSIKDIQNENLMAEIKQLVNYGAQINHKHSDENYQEWTVLHLACQKTNETCVKFLVEQMKADYLMVNGYGNSPIAIAAEYGNLLILKYLWTLPKSNLNVTNKDKWSPLHLATKNHHLPVVRFLVQWGADSQAHDLENRTALDIAKTNVPNDKQDELNLKKLVRFLEQLICPPVKNSASPLTAESKQPNINQDICELVSPIPVGSIQIGNSDPERRGMKRSGLLGDTFNDNLYNAAKSGWKPRADEAIANGADICYRRNGQTPHNVALQTVYECYNQLRSGDIKYDDRQQLQIKMQWCQQIADSISKIAQLKLIEAIKQSDVGLVVAYCHAGAPLTNDLLYRACSSSDNVEIVHFLIQQSPTIFESIYKYTRPKSPYRTAMENKFYRLASYLKYVLSVELTKAVHAKNLPYGKQLVLGGASVDMPDTNNLHVALTHQNLEMIEFLCDNGAKMPIEWLESPSIVLPVDIAQTMSSDIVTLINRCLINRRLRFAAASGDLAGVIQCQRLGANINSKNCYGSTAVLCAIQHGNYFSIVHTLVSCGASILHENINEPMSLIDLAKSKQYDDITNYLTKELNNQFITSIINDDRKSAQKFEKLGIDFNYHDEQKRTALHYAVQYHSIDLVIWLCDRGSSPMSADANGDYPIILATQKGDYPVVELFVLKYHETRRQTNQAGLTALQIAEKLKYRAIAQLIKTGKPVSPIDDNNPSHSPKYTVEKLRKAAEKGSVDIIKEFCDDSCYSKDDKRQLCFELLTTAERNNQFQIVDILKPYYRVLKSDLPPDSEVGEQVKLNKPNKKMLLGFLTGMGKVVADSPVILDPADPSTYRGLFSGLTSKLAERLKQLKKIKNEQNAKEVYEQDSTRMETKLGTIQDQLQKLEETRKETKDRIEKCDEQISKQNGLSALERKDFFEAKEQHEQQLAVYECSISLYQREQEAILRRQKNLTYIKDNTSLFLFFCTMESRLLSLLHSVIVAQSGEHQEATQTKGSKTKKSDKTISSSPLIAFSEVIMVAVKEAYAEILSKLDEKKQKQERYNLITMTNIVEIDRLALDTARIMTLYYKEQIQSIDSTSKITGISPYNNQIEWIKDVFIDVRSERIEEIPVVIVADYVMAWIIDALKVNRKEIKSDKPLPQQLWYLVAKKNLIELETSSKVSNVVRLESGHQKIPLIKKRKNPKLEESPVYVQLRYLISCVSIVGFSGEIYQHSISSEQSTEEDFDDLDVFSYVYVPLFSSDEDMLKSIVAERKMKLAVRNNQNDIVTRMDKIKQLEDIFNLQEMEKESQSYITKETANQVAQVLREQKTFVNGSDLKAELDKARKAIGYTVDALKEDIQNKVKFYQTSIDAAHEQIQQESAKNRKTIEKDNEERYNQAIGKLSQQLKEMKTNLEEIIKQRIDAIEAEMRTKTEEILTISMAAKDQSDQARIQAFQAAQASEKSAEASEKSMKYSQQLIQTTEQRRQELQLVADHCENRMETTITELKGSFEQNASGIRAQFQNELDYAKQKISKLATTTEDSAKAAQNAMSNARDLTRVTKEELGIQKSESREIISEAQEARRLSERAAGFSQEAQRQAKRAADTCTTELSKVDDMYTKMLEAIKRLEKLQKKYESK